MHGTPLTMLQRELLAPPAVLNLLSALTCPCTCAPSLPACPADLPTCRPCFAHPSPAGPARLHPPQLPLPPRRVWHRRRLCAPRGRRAALRPRPRPLRHDWWASQRVGGLWWSARGGGAVGGQRGVGGLCGVAPPKEGRGCGRPAGLWVSAHLAVELAAAAALLDCKGY
jgi:hypothetical protein